MAELLGYLASLLIGISLGLIGGGGSILTVPVLVFLFGATAMEATAYSLFIVGLTALAGMVVYARRGLLDYRTGVVFAIPSFLGVYLVRRFVVPALPEHLFTVGTFEVTRDRGILMLFGLLMLVTALSMIRSGDGAVSAGSGTREYPYGKIVVEGLLVGALTGFLGAGGGFLVIPALVLLAKMPMKQAVGTSLMIIAAKSLLGFVGDLQTSVVAMDWGLMATVSAAALVGLVVGSVLSKAIPGERLKPAFGYFVLVMGMYMLGSQLVS